MKVIVRDPGPREGACWVRTGVRLHSLCLIEGAVTLPSLAPSWAQEQEGSAPHALVSLSESDWLSATFTLA